MAKEFYYGISADDIEMEARPGETWEEAGRRIARERRKKAALPEPVKPERLSAPKMLDLPAWPDSQRGLPNEVFRSALFNARNRNQKREYMSNATIYVIGEGRISYTGQELRQDDQTVWLHLIHLARTQPAGHIVEFTPRDFCKAIGWSISGASYKRLRECLSRLQATALRIYSSRLREGFSLSMIPIFRWKDEQDEALRCYQVTIAPELVEFFGEVHYTWIEWRQRLDLPDGLASWLHGYFSSHKLPFPVKLETIRSGAGLTMERKDHLKEQVEMALEALKTVGFLKTWRIEGDSVYVERT